jgi:CHASE2 domain-containing sensor protein
MRPLRATLLVAGITISALLLLTRTALFREFEAAARDAQARLLAPRTSDRIVLVEIDDRDYELLFQGRSPLAPDMVQRVLDAIRAGGPRAIGVDLDTSHPTFRNVEFVAEGTPMVWARDAAPCDDFATAGRPAGCDAG